MKLERKLAYTTEFPFGTPFLCDTLRNHSVLVQTVDNIMWEIWITSADTYLHMPGK